MILVIRWFLGRSTCLNKRLSISISIKKDCCGFDDNDRPLLNQDINEQIYCSVITWIHNVGLAKLAAQDLVECAWDDKANEMVFWSKETKDDKPIKRRNKKKNKGS